MLLSIYPSTNEKSWISEVWKRMCRIYPMGSMVLLYMVTFTINIPPMLAYIPYMDPMGTYRKNEL